jgi:hypothetical protein
MDAKGKVLAEFFISIMMVQAHWYRVFNLEENEADCQLIKSTFPSITTLMMMDPSYMMQLFLELGLVEKKKVKERYKCFPSFKCYLQGSKI